MLAIAGLMDPARYSTFPAIMTVLLHDSWVSYRRHSTTTHLVLWAGLYRGISGTCVMLWLTGLAAACLAGLQHQQ
jgi:hypothetical protein